MSLYNYEGRDVDFSKRPKKTYLTHRTVTSLYNGMLNPIIPFTIKGLIWYQGESNVEIGGPNFKSYKKLMPLMIEDWRKKWGSNFPFYFAQIAPYFNYQGMLPYFQNIQKKLAKAIPNSEMVVLNDIGEYYDIHPSNKHDVGFRFSQLALKNNYGFNVTVSGPIFSHVKNADNKINIFFTSDNLKLKIISNSTSGFEIAGSDKKFHNATVKIIDNYIEAFSDSVYNPVYVRYAWSDTASATLFNEDGWPASLFSNE
jgi:sialate O-acetylesterase